MNKNNRKAAIAQIHIGKKQLGMDDDTYRALLLRVGKQSSCADMQLSGLYAVIHAMEQLGWKKKRPSRGKFSPRANGQYIDAMRAIWIDMYKCGMINDGSESGLTAYAKRMSSQLNGGIGVDTLEWLETDGKLAAKVLECLKKWRRRIVKEWQKSDFLAVQAYITKHGCNIDVAVENLLANGCIFWWPEFIDLNIDNHPDYKTNRKELSCAD